jgi:hypothetical protein
MEGRIMPFISERLVKLIEDHADTLTRAWMKDVLGRENLPHYHRLDPKELYDRAFSVYSQLGRWIDCDACNQEEVTRHYEALGAHRRTEGFALPEVIEALILIKRHLWLKVLSDGLLDTVLDLHKALELNNRVVRFFDRAIYCAAVGFEAGKR